MNQVRTVLSIQFLNSFISGVLAVAVPLMMKARNIDIIEIGLVFASMPLIMQLGRMFFATLSDFWGRKLFFVSNGFFSIISGIIYRFAHTPLEFLFGKVVEGTKDGTLWAVNRPFLLEKSEAHWKVLVYLRSVLYIAFAVGSLLAGFLVVWLLYEGTMLLCALFGVFIVLFSLLLASGRKEKFNVEKALQFLDFRKKNRIFKIFLILFLMMGVSFGFRAGYVIPLFLDKNGFATEIIGLIYGSMILLAGIFSYLFSRRSQMRQLILVSGVLYSITFSILGFSSSILAAALVISYGFVEGMASVGQEWVLSRICAKESYGIDIGLLMMGLHVGETLSLALSGFLISMWGFVTPFLLSASTYVIFYVTSYFIMKE